MARSVAIIGAGQIGHAAWQCLGDTAHVVTVHARSRPDWLSGFADHFLPYALNEQATPEAEVVFDTIAFDAADIERYDPDRIGRLVVVSSASVYCDAAGRTLDEAAQNGFPELEGPITEAQPTVSAGPETYSTRKTRMEECALELFGDRATILRPCAIYGSHSRHPREWWFVKRMLDGRRRIPLACSGNSKFQTTSSGLIGDFVSSAIERELGGIYNIADGSSPSVLEIGKAISRIVGADVQFEPMEGYPDNFVGRTPWSVPRPFVVDGRKAMKDGGLATIGYEVAAEEAVTWLRDLAPADWRTTFPQLAAYPWEHFDYAAEDALLGAV
ncbi:MAG: reductase [Actinobacteria bacterium]|nr:reductase [Actinomycetota bacterium]